jgi:hypothetical protein
MTEDEFRTRFYAIWNVGGAMPHMAAVTAAKEAGVLFDKPKTVDELAIEALCGAENGGWLIQIESVPEKLRSVGFQIVQKGK